MNRQIWLPRLTWAAALGLVVWILKDLPFGEMVATVARLHPWQWMLWAALNLGILLVYVQRWRCLCLALGANVSFGSLFILRQAGHAISFLTPGPQFGGEPFQVYWLWRRFMLPSPLALLCVLLDRFYELWTNFAFLLLGVLILLLSPALDLGAASTLGFTLAFIILLLTCGGWLLVSHPQKLSDWIKKRGQRWAHNPLLRRIDAHWSDLGSRLQLLLSLQRPALVRAFLLALLGWGAMIFEIWILVYFFTPRPDFITLILMVVGMRLAFLLPIPGGVGTLEAAIFWVFSLLGFPMAGAGAMIAMIRLRDSMVLLFGQFALWRIGKMRPSGDAAGRPH